MPPHSTDAKGKVSLACYKHFQASDFRIPLHNSVPRRVPGGGLLHTYLPTVRLSVHSQSYNDTRTIQRFIEQVWNSSHNILFERP